MIAVFIFQRGISTRSRISCEYLVAGVGAPLPERNAGIHHNPMREHGDRQPLDIVRNGVVATFEQTRAPASHDRAPALRGD